MNRLRFKTSEKLPNISEELREYTSTHCRKKPKDVNTEPGGLGNTGISTDDAQRKISPAHCLWVTTYCLCLTNWKAYLNALSTHIPYRHTIHSTFGRCWKVQAPGSCDEYNLITVNNRPCIRGRNWELGSLRSHNWLHPMDQPHLISFNWGLDKLSPGPAHPIGLGRMNFVRAIASQFSHCQMRKWRCMDYQVFAP